jgi:hypothetical protein
MASCCNIERDRSFALVKDYFHRMAAWAGLTDSGQSTQDPVRYILRGIGWPGLSENAHKLILAAKDGDVDEIKALLEIGGEGIDAAKDDALSLSAMCGYTNIVKMLLVAGANVWSLNHEALRWAEERGYTETAMVLKEWMQQETQKASISGPEPTL